MRTVIFFIHIPKTAGTAIGQMLRRNLRSRLIEVPHVFTEGPIGERQLRTWFNLDTAKLGVASHRLSLDLPLEDCETFSGVAFAVIRNPLDWQASHFHYTRKPGIISFANTYQYSSLEDYLRNLIAKRHDPALVPRSQARFLMRGDHITQESICTLLRQQRLFLIPQEHLLEGVTALSMRFPELLQDPSMEHANVTARSIEPLSPEARHMASELFADDFRLHSLAQDNLKDLMLQLDQDAYQRKLRAARRKSLFRNVLLSRIQSLSERANLLVRSL